jgi:hypothetical protein
MSLDKRRGVSLRLLPYNCDVADDASFDIRLSEARQWCATRARSSEPASSLRTLDLRPRVLEASYPHAVSSVCLYRESALAAERRAGRVHEVDATADGRLLVYFPDADLCDGAAEAESRGFFDVHNCPPWDTWIAFCEVPEEDRSFRNVVVAWVPAILVADAERGVYVNPEQCIQWLERRLADRLGLGRLIR